MAPVHKKHFASEGLAVFGGQIMAALGGLVGVRILTELLSPDEFGSLSLGLTLALVANQIIMGPLGNGVIRFFAIAREQNDQNTFFAGTFNLLKKACFLLGFLGFTATCGLFALGHTAWVGLTLAATLFSVIAGASGILSSIQMAARQQLTVSAHQGVDPWLRLIGAAGIISILGASSYAALIGYALGGVVSLISQYTFFRRVHLKGPAQDASTSSDNSIASDWKKKILTYSSPFAFWGIFTTAQVASDRWALQAISGSAEVGIYAVLYQIGYYPIILLTSTLAQTITPHLYEKAGNGEDNNRLNNASAIVYKSAIICLVLTALMAIAAYFVHVFVFNILVGPSYRSISWMLPLMVIAGGVYATGQVVSLAIQSRSNVSILITPKIGCAILGVAGNLLGAYTYGIPGIVTSIIVCSMIYAVWIFVLSRRFLH